MSQAFYRERVWSQIGFTSLEDCLVHAWEGNFLRRMPEDLLSMIETSMRTDMSDNSIQSPEDETVLRAAVHELLG